MQNLITLFVVGAAAVQTSVPGVRATRSDPVLVRSVLDGDTIDGSTIGRVRLLGVDAPELGRQYDTPAPFAREARERLASLVLKHWVRLEWDGPTRDVYNRHLAYVVREDGLFVNAALVREGLARVPRPGSATFVAELDNEVVGFASAGRSRDEEAANEGELYAIYLHPSCWDRGIGRALLERAEQSMREYGFERAILWVLEGNERGERFYRAAGWERHGRKLDTFGGAEVSELRYRKAL
jgi:endonuclease YncB( thermonuclease family)